MRRTPHLSLLGSLFGAFLIVGAPHVAFAESGSFSTIGHPGNAPDTNGYGAVGYSYRVHQSRISNTQYVEFLNKVDTEAKGRHGLYNTNMETSPKGGIVRQVGKAVGHRYIVKEGFAAKPVVFVSWQDAARYTNWLNNGATASSSTERGAYDLAKAKTGFAKRMAGARFWIPNRNELYKACFYRTEPEEGYSRVSQLDSGAERGRILEIVDPASSPKLEFVGSTNEENEIDFPAAQNASDDLSSEGFRVATHAEDASETEDIIGQGPSGAHGFFMSSPFINPSGPVRETSPRGEEIPTS